MSSIGGFGRGDVDLRCGSLRCRDIVIIDKNCNLILPEGTGPAPGPIILGDTVCARENVLTPKVTEKVLDEGVVVDKSLLLNPNGIARAYLAENISFKVDEEGGNLILDDWQQSFQSFGPEWMNLGEDLIQVPSSFANPCLGTDWCAYLDVDVTIGILFSATSGPDDSYIGLELIQNETIVSRSWITIPDAFLTNGSIHLRDTVKVLPGDTLNVSLFYYLDGIYAFTLLGNEQDSHVQVKLLGFGPGV